MEHFISFEQVQTDWSNALPLGNGKMGAMLFYQDRTLKIVLNHYDVYYQTLSRYTPKEEKNPVQPGKRYEELRKLMEASQDENRFRRNYNEQLHPKSSEHRPLYSGETQPQSGEIHIRFDCEVDDAQASLRLCIEQARVEFTVGIAGEKLRVSCILVKTADLLLLKIEQENGNHIQSIQLIYPPAQGQEKKAAPVLSDEHTALLALPTPLDTAVQMETALTFSGAGGVGDIHEDGVCFQLDWVDKELLLAASVGKGAVAEEMTRQGLIGFEKYQNDHDALWKEFWERGSIGLPDSFLETQWYLYFYLLECSSGRGGQYSEQACGLNGLWDIRRPTLWGSMWYWDVNIQSAFWPSFSSNHLEWAEDFCTSYLAFGEDAQAFAKEVYDIDGWAADYPHALYHCIQPWCAQFLYWYYEYTGDLNFLENKAYPVFQKQIRFLRQLVRWDAPRECYSIEPDISPEQGPLTKNAVITISAVRFLLRAALRSAELLKRPEAERIDFLELLEHLPEYSLTADGTRFRDSEYAPDCLWLRHPSLLMPIFPAGEFDTHSGPAAKKIALETLRYAAEHLEIGMFGVGWLACAAARMGEGDAALRLLYEQGLDFFTHTNGLAYEETDRWLNFCIITKPPLFLPAMMEPCGGLVNAVNEMLLQSHDGVISVFPALPRGHDSLQPSPDWYIHEDRDRRPTYPIWENCRFHRMLAKGGVEVSAEMEQGKVCFIQLMSRRDGTVRLRLPKELHGQEPVEVTPGAGYISFWARAGESYCFGTQPEAEVSRGDRAGVQVREACTHRRVYLGENRHTAFHKAVDSFLFPYRMGNGFREQMTALKFDFGDSSLVKDYGTVAHRQTNLSNPPMLLCTAPRRVSATDQFSVQRGWGFLQIDQLRQLDRGGPDDLRRDLVEGERDATFLIDLPKGKYDLLAICGDEAEVSCTRLWLPASGTFVGGAVLGAGQYLCAVLPVVHLENGSLRIQIETQPGCRWKLNALFLNKDHMIC